MKKAIYSALSILLLCAFQASAQRNLISNGGFENGLGSWTFGDAKTTTLIRRSGDASLALVSYIKGKWEGVDQKVRMPKNSAAIMVSGFYKMDEVEQGENAWNKAVIILEFTNADKKIGEGIPLIEKIGTDDWTAFKKSLRVPDEATGFRLMIALSEASGTFFVDDVSAKLISGADFDKENLSVKTN